MTSPDVKHVRILVINPNSSISITVGIRKSISHLNLPNVRQSSKFHASKLILSQASISYWTNPMGPPVIQNECEIDETSAQCLEPLLQLALRYDGFLVACYADHSLSSQLRLKVAPKPVLGIFETSIAACHDLLIPDARFVILTTGKAWEEPMTEAVIRVYGASHLRSSADRFAGVVTSGITATVYEENSTKFVTALLEDAMKKIITLGNVSVICLGGVILSQMNKLVREAWILELGSERASDVIVMDPVITGISTLHELLCQV